MQTTGLDKTEEDAVNNLGKIKEEVERGRPDLIINKVPKKELKYFKELANQDFDGDYGITIKFLLMYFLDDRKYTMLVERILRLEAVMAEIMDIDDHQEESLVGKRMLDGSVM